jgi:hypothetical protein
MMGTRRWIAAAFAPLLAASCSTRSVRVEMRDGWDTDARGRRIEVESTTIEVTVLDRLSRWSSEDESGTQLSVVIPDSQVKSLPFDVEFSRATCSCVTASPRDFQQGPIGRGTLRFLEAVPTGFVVHVDVTCGRAELEGMALVESDGSRRSGVWPYDPRPPGSTWQEKLVQTARDAWSGLELWPWK